MWWKILLILFALMFLFFLQSVHIIIEYDGDFKLIAGLGFIRLNVLKLVDKMKKKPKKPKEKPKEKSEQKEEKPEKSNVFKEVIELRGVDGAVDLISEFATLLSKFGGGLVKHFVIRSLKVHYSVCGKDAADTAIKFGYINAALFPSLGVIASSAQLKKHEVQIIPDFLGRNERQYVYIHMSYRLLSLIAVLLGAVKDFIAIMKKQSRINARIKARSRAKAAAQAKQLAAEAQASEG